MPKRTGDLMLHHVDAVVRDSKEDPTVLAASTTEEVRTTTSTPDADTMPKTDARRTDQAEDLTALEVSGEVKISA